MWKVAVLWVQHFCMMMGSIHHSYCQEMAFLLLGVCVRNIHHHFGFLMYVCNLCSLSTYREKTGVHQSVTCMQRTQHHFSSPSVICHVLILAIFVHACKLSLHMPIKSCCFDFLMFNITSCQPMLCTEWLGGTEISVFWTEVELGL